MRMMYDSNNISQKEFEKRRKTLRNIAGSLHAPEGMNLDTLRQERFEEKQQFKLPNDEYTDL